MNAETQVICIVSRGDDALQTKTHEVTDALRRTTTLMQAELERSVLSVQMLGPSSPLSPPSPHNTHL